MKPYTLPPLAYDYGALEPHYSARVLELHHDKHHKAYVDGVNTTLDKLTAARDADDLGAIVGLEKTLAFNLSGHVLHTTFWTNLSPDGGDRPDGELAAAIDEHFGSFDAFRNQLTQATATVQGSGWGALDLGAARRTALRRADLRPPGQRRPGWHAAARDRRLGARLLPAIREPARRLRAGDLERRALGRRCGPLRPATGGVVKITRGFVGRRNRDARLPPGQYDAGKQWPVLTAEVTPKLDLATWTFTDRGRGRAADDVDVGRDPRAPAVGLPGRHPLRDDVVEARRALLGRVGRHAARRRRVRCRRRRTCSRSRTPDTRPTCRSPT